MSKLGSFIMQKILYSKWQIQVLINQMRKRTSLIAKINDDAIMEYCNDQTHFSIMYVYSI